MFGRNSFIPLYLKAEESPQAQLAITYHTGSIIAGTTRDYVSYWKLILRIPLEKWGHKMTS